MMTKTLAFRLATGLAGSVALLGTLVTPAFAYYSSNYSNSSAYCTDRYSPNCGMETWGPGYYQNFNTNYNSWYQTSSPYYNSYSYPMYQYQQQYYQPTSYYNSYSNYYPSYNYSYSTPSYSYQYQYQYQYSY